MTVGECIYDLRTQKKLTKTKLSRLLETYMEVALPAFEVKHFVITIIGTLSQKGKSATCPLKY